MAHRHTCTTHSSSRLFNNKKNRLTQAIIATITASPILLSSVVYAEEAQSQQAKESEIEVVTVTAQKRIQNILKVPVTVGTVSQDTIEESGSLMLSDVDKFIPGFDFSDGNVTQAGVSMRGISSPNISVGGDPSSATFYDDVYMPRAAQNVVFTDMARIEVLKGPQGTLFGRNAAMGVVNMVPKAPSAENEGFIKASLGTDNFQRYEGMFNAPLTDNLYIRGNFLSNTQDGFIENQVDPAWNTEYKTWDLGARDHMAARLSVLWDIADGTDFQLSYDWDDLEQAPPMAVGVSKYAYDGGKSYMGDKAENDVRNGVEGRDMYALTAKFNHEFSDHWSMKYVLSYRDWETVNRQDEDGTADIRRYFDTSNNEDSDILYTELQLNYVSDKINAVMGFSYSKEKVAQTTELNMTADTAATLITGDLNNQIDQLVAAQVAGMLGGNSDAHASAAFGPGVTFATAVQTIKSTMGIEEMEHMWNADEWAGTINALGFADQIMAAIGMPGQPLTADIVAATGNLTYDIISTQLPGLVGSPALYVPEIFGPGYGGQFWQESVNNTGEFTNWGIFADVDYAINDKWNVIAGIRYSKDTKDFSWYIPQNSFANVPRNSLIPDGMHIPINNLLFPQASVLTSDAWDKVTGRLVTSYQVTDDHMLFASYATGYKSGGFDSLTPADVGFEPEDTANFEIGYKGVIWDEVVANVSAYYLEYTNLQESRSIKEPGDIAAVPRIINIDKNLTGLELDVRWSVTDSINLGMVTEIRSTDTKTPAYYNGEGTLVDAQTTNAKASSAYTFTFDWMPDFGVGTTNLHVDYVFVENTNRDREGLEEYAKVLPEYFMDIKSLNGRLSWANDDDNLEFGLWGKNLLDRRHVLSVGGLTADVLGTPAARINRGLEAGIDVKYSF